MSVKHLQETFLQRVTEAGFDQTSKVFEVEPQVIRSPGESVKCPRDGRMGAAYVDTLVGADQAGASTHMLSYTWNYSVGDIVHALQEVNTVLILRLVVTSCAGVAVVRPQGPGSLKNLHMDLLSLHKP